MNAWYKLMGRKLKNARKEVLNYGESYKLGFQEVSSYVAGEKAVKLLWSFQDYKARQ